MSRFSQRSSTLEIMDDLNCSGEVVHQTLRELDVINRWLGGNRITLQALHHVIAENRQAAYAIADLGCGSGEMLRLIKNKFPQHHLRLTGIDANLHIIEYARRHLHDNTIELIAEDIFSPAFRKRSYDIVLATLFFHHFTSEQLVQIFKQLSQQARLAVVVNDLHRHPLAYHSIRLLTRLFSKSAMVKYDAPLSVLRGFTRCELIKILQQAGIRHYELRWKWAFRWQLVIHTNDLA